MPLEDSQNGKISGGGTNGGGKGVSSAIHRRRANRVSLNIKKRHQKGVV